MPSRLIIPVEARIKEPGAYVSLLGHLYCVEFWEQTGPTNGNLHCVDARSEYVVTLTDAQSRACAFVRAPATP